MKMKPTSPFRSRVHRATALTAAALITACAAPPAPPPPPTGGLAELMERPGERLLFEGIRAYDDGQYPQAEAALRKALSAGLASAPPYDEAALVTRADQALYRAKALGRDRVEVG